MNATNLRHLLMETDHFVVAAEIVTSRGLITESRAQRILMLARELVDHPRIDVLSITDNPGGHAMLSADTLGTDLIARGQEVIIHLACKDWNRNALESRGWKLSSEGFHNVLALSGDYPVSGYRGVAAPVFDIDSVALLRMFSDLNEGVGLDVSLGRTAFFLGAVVTNHKRHEREVMPQYFKLRKKIENGASFVINQIGYDARKDDELIRWMALHSLDVPVLANVYLLTPESARVFHAGRIPGAIVTDDLRELVDRQAQSADRGAHSSSSWPRSRLRSPAASATGASTSAATCSWTSTRGYSTPPTPSRRTTGRSSHARSSSRSQTSSTTSSATPRPASPRPR